jgi:2-polyprenyl-6-methoxyphenol hydroxylase-like FAD-dependent oxidoreductase
MVLGLLLARGGVRVTVLEKHADFRRDFRGDTVHPSTLQLLDDLGLWERFAALPQSRFDRVAFDIDGRRTTIGDFSRLPVKHRYVAIVPQWDLLDLLADAGRQEPGYELRMSTEATDLVRTNGRVTGVRFRGPDGPGELAADLVAACDGRHSRIRQAAGLPVKDFPVGVDAWWFRVPIDPDAQTQLFPTFSNGRALIAIPRRDHLQLAYLAPKGTDAQLRARGIEAFRDDVAGLRPDLADGLQTIESMDQVKHLDILVNRLMRWYADGLLCLGDAAHAMSPVGGIGINLAIQDAVAAATRLAGPLGAGAVTEDDLDAIQRRRQLAVIVSQRLQLVMHRFVVEPVIRGERPRAPTAAFRLASRVPLLSAVPAYLIGVGPRPERAPGFARRPTAGVGRP